MGTEEGKPASELGEGEDDSTLVTGGGRAGDDDKDGITEQNAAAGGGGGANSSPDEGGIALVGGVGSDFVSRALSTFAPQEAVHDIQQKTRVTDERCEPVFGLLRQVGRSRAEVNRSLLASLTQLLLRRVKQLDPSRQEEAALDLLEKSFIYIRIPEVRCIPIAVLEHLRAIPNNFLKQLSADPIVFETLPASVKRQVWELDKSLLQQRVSPLVAEYGGEAESAEALLDLGVCGKYKLRQQHRARSQALKQVSAILDRSTKIYKYVVNLVLTLYRESERSYLSREELSLCAFRSQLLMQLHDAQNELRQQDPCHRLAWVLDQALRDGECGDRRVNELVQVMRPYDKQQHQGGRGRKRGRGDHHHHADPHGGGSTSQPDESTALGEMGMVLRDPPVFAFLAGTCYDRLRQVVKLERVPKQDFNLVFLTRLLQLACESRQMLREKRYKFHKAEDGLLRDFYPRLCSSVVDRALVAKGRQVDARQTDPTLVSWLANSGVAQAVYQQFVLDCLSGLEHGQESSIAEQALMTCAVALSQISTKALSEWSPFAHTLCGRVTEMLGAGKLEPASTLWDLAVDRVLVKACGQEVEVHLRVVGLLGLAARAKKLDGPALCSYLERTLESSEKARRRRRKRAAKEGKRGNESDGVYPAYQELRGDLGDLEHHPKLKEYLNDGD